ncbi:Presenilin-like protein [Seminavis robusta]|uniref:Presenilin n=1 Tax=Seminavis robusta TaxID=568900 RepID=A0A9N8EVC2_9STRA|nr:Presenilin-like protein [Seminavis robusta]|eukprot:Sro1797_g298220.1 Presenilin-like protein (565) ;mRNA; f:19183-21155
MESSSSSAEEAIDTITGPEMHDEHHHNEPATDQENAAGTSIPISSIYYVQESFKATAVPVTITMILSALASNFIRTEESAEAREETLTSSYSAITVSEDASSGEQIGIGLVNGLVIIAAITAMTFFVVLLYKYRCMCFLKGYLVVSITFLLGYFGAVLFHEAIKRYNLLVTKISFVLLIYNFTVVGVYALFFGHGVPPYVGQGYLIAISVILAWELAHFSEVTAWVLLVLLALYDLYAVLTPCGPLKALVNLMGQDNAPKIPGLLYEAQLPSRARRQPATNRGQPSAAAGPSTSQNQQQHEPKMTSSEQQMHTEQHASEETAGRVSPDLPVVSQSPRETVMSGTQEGEFEMVPRPTGAIPLAMAKLYKIPLVDGTVDGDHSVEELKSLVTVYYPSHGGHMEPLPSPPPVEAITRSRFGLRRRNRREMEPAPSPPTKYNVVDRDGVIKRTIFVGDDGKVYRVLDEEEQEEQEDRSTPSTVKLGLGDFIFYSVLVSKASLYSFTTFAACVVGILTGLLLTLVLLAIRGKALPALPISIFFGVLFYLPTRFVLEPWIHNMYWFEFYV